MKRIFDDVQTDGPDRRQLFLDQLARAVPAKSSWHAPFMLRAMRRFHPLVTGDSTAAR